MNARELLDALFDADRKLRDAEAVLLQQADAEELAGALEQAAGQAITTVDDPEARARLTRISDLCAQAQGPRTADTLLRILDHPAPEVRVAAGEALRDFAYDRYAEVARAIERLFERATGGPALQEVPWILAEIGEPSAVPLIARCLLHADVEVVASGIEALAEIGDETAIPMLRKLTKDKRVVQLEEGDESYTTTVGELASEAISELEAS
jgi:HEAT repeat protein